MGQLVWGRRELTFVALRVPSNEQRTASTGGHANGGASPSEQPMTETGGSVDRRTSKLEPSPLLVVSRVTRFNASA